MNSLQLMQYLTREMLRQTQAPRCLCVRAFDIGRNQHVFRWLGGGKDIGLRIPMNVDDKTAAQYAETAFNLWKAVPAGIDDDAQYEMWKREAETAGYAWDEERSQ